MAKRKKKEEHEDLIHNDHVFIPDDHDEKPFSEENLFLDDTPYVRPINEKFDKDGLYLMQHLIILHLAIKAGYFPEDRFPHLKDKCFQYYQDRDLVSTGVKPQTFYKSYSDFIQVDFEDGNRVIPREKFISSSFIETIMPFVEEWYPYAVLFVQTLNTTPYKLEPIYYYWIYREVSRQFRGSMEDFRMEYCAHIPKETFRTWQKRYAKTETPDDLKEYIKHYIDFNFSTG